MSNTILNKQFTIGKLHFVNEYETRGLIYEIFYQKTYLSDYLTLSPGSIIIDVRAHIGLFSLFALRQCKHNALIYSFEPIPISFQCLTPFEEECHLYNVGVADVAKDCLIEFTVFGKDLTTATYKPQDKMISNYNHLLDYDNLLKIARYQNNLLYYQMKFLPFMRPYLIKKNFKNRTMGTKILCKLISLGHFIERNAINHIDFLKINVEGAEFEVVKSIEPKQFFMIKQLSTEMHDIDNRVEYLAAYLREQVYLIRINRNPIYKKLGWNQYMIYAKRAV